MSKTATPAKKKPLAKTARSYTNGPVAMAQAVRPLVKKALPKSAAFLAQLFDAWPDLTQNGVAHGTIPEKLVMPRGQQHDGTLHLWARTSAQAMEIAFSQAQILQTVNAFFGRRIVRDIRITAFPVTIVTESATVQVSQTPRLSCQSLDKSLSGISNPFLKSLLMEFGGLLESGFDQQPSAIQGESNA